MSRVIHTGQALVDVVVEVPDLPARGQNVMALYPPQITLATTDEVLGS